MTTPWPPALAAVLVLLLVEHSKGSLVLALGKPVNALQAGQEKGGLLSRFQSFFCLKGLQDNNEANMAAEASKEACLTMLSVTWAKTSFPLGSLLWIHLG